MRPIKRLYLFMLQSFLPVFLMTFFICLFIFLLQFLWKYVDEMVGKGLEISVLIELFWYVSLSVVPMALPLSILLASLMTFGNLGESLELLAIKAAGVSLIHVMRPLVVLIAAVSIGGFFFQNNVLPYSQVKMWTLLFSMRQKSPELDIPEGTFYDQISGINLFVREKDRKTGMMHEVMIYDMTQGFDNAMVIVADSGKLKFTDDKRYLVFTLYSGESFENLKEQRTNRNNVPYRRESFSMKEILIEFDANFDMMDESVMQNQYVGKDYAQLSASIDSMSHRTDSIGSAYGREIQGAGYFTIAIRREADTLAVTEPLVDMDSSYLALSMQDKQLVISRARARANQMKSTYEYKGLMIKNENRIIRRHAIELHRKFTLSFACLLFFFIGAPLGSIIRKGGLGMPIVTSVILFIFYYIIDNSGYKMARDGVWDIWSGMWISTVVLLLLGIYLTYHALRDSDVFNPDAYINFFRRLFGIVDVRKLTVKEVAFVEVTHSEVSQRVAAIAQLSTQLLGSGKRQSFVAYWLKGYDLDILRNLRIQINSLVEYAQNSSNPLVVSKLMQYPLLRIMPQYHLIPNRVLGGVVMVLLPLSLPLYWMGCRSQRKLRRQLQQVEQTGEEMIALLERDFPTEQ